MELVFGYLHSRSRSLYPGMLLNASWNALQVFADIWPPFTPDARLLPGRSEAAESP